MTPRRAVAAFDVDGTLTVRDCVGPFLVRLGGRRGLLTAAVRRPAATLTAAARRDRDRLKEILVGGVLGNRRVADVAAAGAAFAADVGQRWLRPDTLARLRWHQRRGDATVLVSASLGPYLRPLGRSLGVDDVLCTDGAVSGERYLAALDGANCRAGEKVRRLEQWLVEHGLRHAELWAYGDSAGDRELLARADYPLLVRDITVPEVPQLTGGPG